MIEKNQSESREDINLDESKEESDNENFLYYEKQFKKDIAINFFRNTHLKKQNPEGY